ncbi:MAG: hypothetical protein IT428_20095 [Planctomycetaceae bacterium]|nr:hypothetical protein [Planctomycetaceae bacterium]
MAEVPARQSADAERRKKIVAGLLFVTFVVVLFVQFSGGGEAEIELPPRRPRPAQPTTTGDARRASRAWPEASLDQVLKSSPFRPLRPTMEEPEPEAKPPVAAMEAPNAAAEADRSALNAFANRRVGAIVYTKNGPAAMIGTTLVREGDVIDGVRVVSILADGIVVEPATRR